MTEHHPSIPYPFFKEAATYCLYNTLLTHSDIVVKIAWSAKPKPQPIHPEDLLLSLRLRPVSRHRNSL